MTEQRLWSVTTLISAALGKSDALIGWAARTTAEGAYDKHGILRGYVDADDRAGAIKWLTGLRFQKSGTAADRGTLIHDLAEATALGAPLPLIPDELEPYAIQYRRFLADHRPRFLAAEAQVYNQTHAYAGTLDAIAVIDGTTVLLDMKTTDKGPDARSRPPYPEIALQLVAYRYAEQIGMTPKEEVVEHGRRYYIVRDSTILEPMPTVEGSLALIVSPFDYELRSIDTGDHVWRAFGHVLECARWQLETSRTVIGPLIGAGIVSLALHDPAPTTPGERAFGEFMDSLPADTQEPVVPPGQMQIRTETA